VRQVFLKRYTDSTGRDGESQYRKTATELMVNRPVSMDTGLFQQETEP